MPRGARFVTVFYPGRIRMPEHTGYLVNVDGRIGSILLYRHLTPVEAVDFDNAIVRTTEAARTRWTLQRAITMPTEGCIAMEGNGQLIYVFEDGVQYYRLFRPRDFTEIFIVYEIEDTANISDDEKSRHELILDRFLMAYRAFTGDVTIRMPSDLIGDVPFARAGVREYTEEDLQVAEAERLTRVQAMDIRIEGLPFGINPHMLTPPSVDPEHVGPIISTFLAGGESVPEPQAVLIKATEELKIGQDYRYALLLAFFSIEQVVTDFLHHIKEQAGVSRNTLKSYEGEIGMSYKINVELPLVLRTEHSIRQLLPDLNSANTLRNGVVHKGRSVTYQEAASVIQTADKLIKALG